MFSSVPHFQRLAEKTNQVFFVYSLTAKQMLYLNEAYEKVLRCRRGRIEEDLPELIASLHPDDFLYLRGCYKQLLKGEELMEGIEFRLQRDDASVQWLCVTAHRTEETPGQVLLTGFLHDITGYKEYMENAHRYNMKKNSTLEILSHDLAGPLSFMQGLATRLEEKMVQYNDPTINELIRIIGVTCGESVDLIRDFVNQEFLDSVNVDLKKERVDLAERLRILIGNYQESEQNIAKKFRLLTCGAPVYVGLDSMKFMQVMNNLISNAIKFTPDGGHIDVRLEEQPKAILVTVADDGIGIPAEFQSVLFEKFTKARRPGLRGEKSTGLGMSIIKTIVELHQGRIWFESAENRGSTFYIELPKE
ncbi:PAS domain-containing sensor histidine kinase [Hymenobacter jejuensis]|uniref:histidine kinase n=1 Tax=Hymenobacter jejuensis TaxID=2502781 RepID=A0A5B7ZZS2_9BACT|nr:ATP-binding protein [Hymenobacter jejuensis]QDA59895.1 PAS domain S-box protein [Hymenobacter jejuensis]